MQRWLGRYAEITYSLLRFVAGAMFASGRRIHRAVVLLLALLIVGWSVADLVGERTTSPASMLGQLALWPARAVLRAVGGAVGRHPAR